MTTRDEVELYLAELHAKVGVWGLMFRSDRGKNMQTLLDLELSVNDVKEIIRNLKPANYVEGPVPDTLYKGPSLWVFGREIKGREIYIKVTIGPPNAEAICISFHHAEFPLKHPF